MVGWCSICPAPPPLIGWLAKSDSDECYVLPKVDQVLTLSYQKKRRKDRPKRICKLFFHLLTDSALCEHDLTVVLI